MINICIDNNADYLPLIKKTDLLITDYTSLMFEFFLSNVPVIYCDNTNDFCKEALEMTSAMYNADSWDKIEHAISQIITGEDKFISERKRIIKKYSESSNKNAGREIVNYLFALTSLGDEYNE